MGFGERKEEKEKRQSDVSAWDVKSDRNITKAQQIRTLEEAMAKEERAEYLDAWDMGQDFWSARA